MATPIMTLTQEQIRPFVLAGHGDLDTVKKLLVQQPALLNAVYEEWDETALAAASHMGAREIANYLLDQGSTPTIMAAAMLGMKNAVEAFLKNEPQLAHAKGAHGISLMAHVAISGSTAIADLLWKYGAKDDLDSAIHGAVSFGHLEMLRWLLDHGATEVNIKNFRDETPLDVARGKGFDEIAALLIEHGAE